MLVYFPADLLLFQGPIPNRSLCTATDDVAGDLDRLGRTASGRIWQLASPEMHHHPAIVRLSTTLSSTIYDELSGVGMALPDPSRLAVQVFPVHMEGDPHEPPRQKPHRDIGNGRHPLVTSLYYPYVGDVDGGHLVLHHADGRASGHVPRTDDLVVIDGRQLHSVDPLLSGLRTTFVINYFDS